MSYRDLLLRSSGGAGAVSAAGSFVVARNGAVLLGGLSEGLSDSDRSYDGLTGLYIAAT